MCKELSELHSFLREKKQKPVTNGNFTSLKSYIDDFEYVDKDLWYSMIQLLPESYNQMRTCTFNYENLAGMYYSRRNHKLAEWHTFCDWALELPYFKELLVQE